MLTMSPCLMFKKEAEEASRLYREVFPNSEILNTSHYTAEEMKELERLPADQRPGPAGAVKMIVMKINGMKVYLANGGPFFEFNHAVSMFVHCETQQEIDQIWDKMQKAGGTVEECGWIRDKFGVPWQIVPAILDQWLTDADPEKSGRVSRQIFRSKKLVIEELKRAAEGR